MTLDRVIAVRNRKTIYRDGDRCIKVFLHGYKKQDVLLEALNQALMEEKGLCVPPVWEVTQVENHWAIVSPYVPGETMDVLMEKQPSDDSFLMKMARLQNQINHCPGEGFRDQKRITERNILRTRLPEERKKTLLSLLSRMPDEQMTCHGHFGASNIIVQPCGKCCIVDFSHAAKGSPAADAAAAFLYFFLLKKKEDAKAYLRCYSQVSGCDLEKIRAYLPLMAASRFFHANERERKLLEPLILNPAPYEEEYFK